MLGRVLRLTALLCAVATASAADASTGKGACILPHGVLFRKEEAEMRENLVRRDLVECVLGLGPGLFYNSPMEACVVICRTQKPKARRGKVLFIDAVNELARERAQSFLRGEHQSRVLDAYKAFADEPGFTVVSDAAAIEKHALPIRSAVLMQLTEAEGDPLLYAEGKNQLRRKLTKAINAVLAEKAGEARIDDVYFTSFIIQ